MNNQINTTELATQKLSKALDEFGNAAGSAFWKISEFEKQVVVLKNIGKISADRLKRRYI